MWINLFHNDAKRFVDFGIVHHCDCWFCGVFWIGQCPMHHIQISINLNIWRVSVGKCQEHWTWGWFSFQIRQNKIWTLCIGNATKFYLFYQIPDLVAHKNNFKVNCSISANDFWYHVVHVAAKLLSWKTQIMNRRNVFIIDKYSNKK